MHDELTQVDIDKMKEELQHRIQVLRPQLIEEVKAARSFQVSDTFAYYVQIQQVEKTGEDPDLPISTF